MNASIATFWIAPAGASGPVRDSVLPIRTGFCACTDVPTHSSAAASAARQMKFMLLLLWSGVYCALANTLSMVK